MKIHYRTEPLSYADMICTTPCPFTDPAKRGNTVKVGSMACDGCEHFIRKDMKRQVVTCDQPAAKAVFCKKDRALNPQKKNKK